MSGDDETHIAASRPGSECASVHSRHAKALQGLTADSYSYVTQSLPGISTKTEITIMEVPWLT